MTIIINEFSLPIVIDQGYAKGLPTRRSPFTQPSTRGRRLLIRDIKPSPDMCLICPHTTSCVALRLFSQREKMRPLAKCEMQVWARMVFNRGQKLDR